MNLNQELDLGNGYFQRKDYSQARKKYLEITNNRGFNSGSKIDRSKCWYNFALACYELAIATQEDNLKESYLTEAIKGFFESAKLQTDRTGEVKLALSKMYLLRGWCRLSHSLLPAAEEDLKSAINEFKGTRLSQENKAEFEMRKIELNELERNIACSKGDNSYDKGDYQEAISNYLIAVGLLEAAIEMRPANRLELIHIRADTYNNLAECNVYLQKNSEALIFFNLAYNGYKTVDPNSMDFTTAIKLEESARQIADTLSNFDQAIVKLVAEEKQRMATAQTSSEKPKENKKRKLDVAEPLPEGNSDNTVQPTAKTDFFANKAPKSSRDDELLSDEKIKSMNISQLEEYLTKLREVHLKKQEMLNSLTEMKSDTVSL